MSDLTEAAAELKIKWDIHYKQVWGTMRIGGYVFLCKSFLRWPDGDLTISLFVCPDGENAFLLESWPWKTGMMIEKKMQAYYSRLAEF